MDRLVRVASMGVMVILTGCVLYVPGEGTHSWDSEEDWKRRQSDNREYIAELDAGADLGLVRDDLGRPDFSETFDSDGRAVTVLFYRTHHEHSDGDTSRDETTPLVFVDGVLRGWGETAYRDWGGQSRL